MDNIYIQQIAHKYSNGNNTKACIDHILTDSIFCNNKSEINCTIIDELLNFSDHKTLCLDFTCNQSILAQHDENEEQEKFIEIYPNLDDIEIRARYLKEIEKLLMKVEIKNELNEQDTKKLIDNLHINLTTSIKSAYETLIIVKNNGDSKRKPVIWTSNCE